jgi:crotonobetainyl-CoA:carnitine CoA-transferase CaiB-like acyl-CoA transferase
VYRDAKRLKNGDEVRRLISEWTSSRSKTAIVAVLGGRVPCAPVNTVADIFADPHVAAADDRPRRASWQRRSGTTLRRTHQVHPDAG